MTDFHHSYGKNGSSQPEEREPDAAIGPSIAPTEAERHKLLIEWNQTTIPFPENTCIHQHFEEQVRRTPDATAVVFCDREWTYAQLDAEAESIAARLRAQGVVRGSFVAICINRSLELMATLLGVLKSGAAYVPLDPSYPRERLAFMIGDAQPAVIAVTKQTAANFAGTAHRLLPVDEAAAFTNASPSHAEVTGSDAAYVLYTSGSTGKPKGVVVTHRNVSNFFTAMDMVIGTDPGVWLAVTSINFDISVFELFWTLARGFKIVLQEEGQLVSQTGSEFSLPQQIKRHSVTHLQCTPSLASMLVRDSDSLEAIRPLRRFMVGGEPLPFDLAQRLVNAIAGELVNLYGPTETTVWSAAQRIERDEKQIFIGRPVANTQLYILDEQRELVSIGNLGELYIGGDGLAREYLHRPDVTQERFITHSFAHGQTQRLYRTGDLVRYANDGRIEFAGRIDQQIKIHGVRIEPGEIEAALREHSIVRDAAVIVQDDNGDKRLIAYVILKSTIDASAIQQWLSAKLPKPLVPTAIVFLNEFPRTPNGKLDRLAFPRHDPHVAAAPKSTLGNELESQIVAIWSDVLGNPGIGLDERFFDIGGHSLQMAEVHDKLRDQLGQDIPLLDLFQFPTVRSLATHIQTKTSAAPSRATNLNRGKMRRQMHARQASIRKSGSLSTGSKTGRTALRKTSQP